MIHQAVILCGGQGTRLKNISASLPKVMMPVGGKPLLEDQIESLKRYGTAKIILCTGYMSDVIEKHFGDGKRFGVSIEYSPEENPLGTAGAVRNIRRGLEDDFFVVYGDIFFRVDLRKLAAFHAEKGGMATCVLHRSSHLTDSDVAEIDDDGLIVSFRRRKVWAGEDVIANAALLALNRGFLSLIPQGRQADFSLDVFPDAVKRVRCYGYVTDEYIVDIGTEDRYKGLLSDLSGGLKA